MLYTIVYWIAKVIIWAVFWPRIKGKENLNIEGGYIIAANHKSNFDAVFVALVQKRQLSFIAKEELFKNKLFGWVLTKLNAHPIKRNSADIATLKLGINVLCKGEPLTIFPQGRRTNTIDTDGAKSGIALLLTKSKVPVLPIGLGGRYRPFGGPKINIGELMHFDEYFDKKNTSDDLKQITKEIMTKIEELANE